MPAEALSSRLELVLRRFSAAGFKENICEQRNYRGESFRKRTVPIPASRSFVVFAAWREMLL
jgi:hypothetical protein